MLSKGSRLSSPLQLVWLGFLLWGLALPRNAPAAERDIPAAQREVMASNGAGRMARVTVGSKNLGPDQIELLERRRIAERGVLEALGPHGVSRKARALIEQRKRDIASGKIGPAQPEVLRVLLVRIAFEEDRSGSLTSITEDGDFQLDPDESILFDPPPHDKAYFESHLRGLSSYWGSMSDGLLQIDAQVLPAGDTDSYKLSDIADYGPGSGGFWDIDGLVRLVQDMIVATDEGTQADGTVNLADFDFDDPNTYIIFAHAGGDLQSNLVRSPGQSGYSPNDIPTFFVQLGDEDFVDLTSTDTDTGELGRVTECSVIPETTSQDGLNGSIGAPLYHEFGHALGLPDLYNTFNGLPQVGYWDIMGTGTNLEAVVNFENDPRNYLVVGLLPPSTSVWCKWFLGWVDPVVAGGRIQKRSLVPSHRQVTPEAQAILIDVSPDEFYLVENRWIPPIAEGVFLYRDPDTRTSQYLALDDGSDPPTNSNLYDFFMPWPGGLLVWRVRQDIIDATIDVNVIQALDTPGLSLVEADGIQDIGVFEFSTVGLFGSDTDAFRDGSSFEFIRGANDTLRIEYPTTATEFTPTSLPNSNSSFGFHTGVQLLEVPTSVDDEMFFRVGVEDGVFIDLGDLQDPYFPLTLPPVAGTGGALVPIAGDAQSLGFFQFDRGPAFVMTGQASDASGAVGLYAYNMRARPRFPDQPRISDLTAPLVGPLVWARDFSGQDVDALVAVSVDGNVHAFTSEGVVGTLAGEVPPFPVAYSDSVDTAPIVMDSGTRRYVVTANVSEGRLFVVGDDGLTHADWSDTFPGPVRSGAVAADLTGSGSPDKLAFIGGASLQGTEVSGQTLPGFPVSLPSTFFVDPGDKVWLVAWPSRGTVNRPDRILIASENQDTGLGLLLRAEQDADSGEWSSDFFGRVLSTFPIGEPALGDLDGDGALDLVVATQGRVWARNETGVDMTGWPIDLAEQYLSGYVEDGPGSTPLIVDVDADGLNEVVILSQGGLLYALEHDGKNTPGYPRKFSSPTPSPMVVDVETSSRDFRSLVLFEALGDTIRAGNRTRSARLSALDLGEAPTLGAGQRPAEWLMRGGNAFRTARGAAGAVSSSTGPAVAVQTQRPILYPNPIRSGAGASARVRFFSAQAQTARLTLFNLEGEKILESEQFNQGGVTGEVAWDARFLAPGAYVCRLDYIGEAGPATEVLTVYVER